MPATGPQQCIKDHLLLTKLLPKLPLIVVQQALSKVPMLPLNLVLVRVQLLSVNLMVVVFQPARVQKHTQILLKVRIPLMFKQQTMLAIPIQPQPPALGQLIRLRLLIRLMLPAAITQSILPQTTARLP